MPWTATGGGQRHSLISLAHPEENMAEHPGMQFPKGVATLPKEGIWRDLFLTPSTWICCLLDMTTHLRAPDAPRKHYHDTQKQRYFTCAQFICKLFRYCGGKEKLIATWVPDTSCPLTQKLQLVSSIICVDNRSVAGRIGIALTFNFSCMWINFQRKLWMFQVPLGFSLTGAWEWSDRL